MKSPGVAALLLALLIPPQQQSGSFEVKVIDALTGNGVSDATITLVPVRTPVKTGEDGRAVFSELAAQNYAFRVERARYAAADPRSVPDYISVAAGQKKELQIVMNPLSVVSGRVINRNGNPVPLALVYLMSIRYIGGRKTLVRDSNPLGRLLGGQTDDRGEYRIADVPPGGFFLWVDNSSLLGSKDAQDRLPRSVYYPGVVDFASATRIVVRGNDVGFDVQMPATPVFSVSGTVINRLPIEDTAGRPAQRGVSSFYLGLSDPNVLQDPFLASNLLRGSPDAEESPFELIGLSPGAYVLYPIFGSGPTNPTIVRIEDRNVTGLRIEAKPTVNLQGKVFVEGEAGSVPMQSVFLGMRPKDRIPGTLTLQAQVSPPSAQSGEFVITGIVQDIRLRLLVNGLRGDSYVSDIRQGGNSVLNDGFILTNPSAGAIEIRLNPRGGLVQGTVSDGTGKPADRATVVLVPDFPRRNNSLLYRRVLTEADGRFSLRGLAPGEYRLFAIQDAPPMGAEEDLEFIALHETRTVTVSILPGMPTNSPLSLP